MYILVVLHDKDGQAVSDDDDETSDGRRMIKVSRTIGIFFFDFFFLII